MSDAPPENLPVEERRVSARRSPRARQPNPTRKRKKFLPTPRDLEILRLVARFRFLQPRHIHAVLEGSAQQIARRCGELYHEKFLDRPRNQFGGGAVHDPVIYALTNTGRALIGGQRPLPFLTDYSENNRTATAGFMAHTIASNEFLITLEHGAKSYGYELRWGGHRSTPILEVPWLDGPARFQADALVWLEHPQRGEVAHFLETDRSTITLERMRERYMRYYLWWKSDAPQALLGRDDFRIVTVTKSPERMATLRKEAAAATAAVLGRAFREPWRGFLFTHAGAFDITHPRSITERIFHFATDEPPISLLE